MNGWHNDRKNSHISEKGIGNHSYYVDCEILYEYLQSRLLFEQGDGQFVLEIRVVVVVVVVVVVNQTVAE